MFDEVMMRERVERMERMLHEAAVKGSVTSLSQLLQEDQLILDRYLVGCLSETPLHIAAMLGHIEFVQIILNLKPELAGELDFRGSSPLHLATAKGYVEIVKLLLLANSHVCFAQDIEGRNPLHVAVIKGRFNVLKELVQARPEAARALVDRGKTILHLCVDYNQLEALKVLIEIVGDPEFVNLKDQVGFTILHLAVADKHTEIIRFLISLTTLQVNALNSTGFTALDILTQSRRDVKDVEIGESLRCAGALRGNEIPIRLLSSSSSSPPPLTDKNNHSKSRPLFSDHQNNNRQQNWVEEKQNTLMIVASLIATIAFQAGITPPNFSEDNLSSPATAPATATATYFLFLPKYFIAVNSVGLAASLSVILLQISGLPVKHRFFVWILTAVMWLAILAMTTSYTLSLYHVSPDSDLGSVNSIVFVWILLFIFGHAIRLLVNQVRKLRSKKQTEKSFASV